MMMNKKRSRDGSSFPKILAAAMTLGVAFAAAKPASAIVYPPKLVWVPLGTGCASAIAVGANNVPWVLGCTGGNPNPTGPASVYYLTYPCDGLLCSPQWAYDNFRGVTLSVSVNGEPFVTDASGAINTEYVNGALPAILGPTGNWQHAGNSQGAVSSFAAGVTQIDDNGGSGEYFYPVQFGNPTDEGVIYAQNTFWGLGCGSSCGSGPFSTDSHIYQMETYLSAGDMNNQWTGWNYIGGAADRIVFFTDPPTSGTLKTGFNTVQSPWVLTSKGNVFFYANGSFIHQLPPYNLAITSITDHYILADNTVYAWTGTSTGGGAAAGDSNGWVQYVQPFTASGTTVSIKQIASSQAVSGAFVGRTANVGPSELWGIDYAGAIYSAQWITPTTPE